MRQKATIQSLIDFHQARLTALDHSKLVRELMLESPYPLKELTSTLNVSELGAYSIIAMFRCEKLPERHQILKHLDELEQIRQVITDQVSRYLLSTTAQTA